MLASLVSLADRLEVEDPPIITPMGYANAPIRWVVPLDHGSHLLRAPYRTTSGVDDAAKRYVVPDIVRTSGIKPKLLSDNGEYTFGFGADTNDIKGSKRHAAYLELLRRCWAATGSADVRAVLQYLEGFNASDLDLGEDFNPSDRVTFEVDGRLPFEDPEVAKFWAETVVVDPDGPTGEDLMTGERGLLMETEPAKIKGTRIPNGQTSGMNLMSANKESSWSYGAKKSFNAPILAENADRYSKALNHLLETDAHHLRIGDVVYVFWTNSAWVPPIKDVLRGQGDDALNALFSDTGNSPSSLRTNADPEDVDRLLNSVWTAPKVDGVASDLAFHAVALSAAGSRIAVRNQIQSTVTQVRRNLQTFITRSSMVATDGQPGNPIGVFALAASMYQDANKQMVASVPTAIVRHALDQTPLPASLLDAVVQRNRIERAVTRPRAVLARLLLTSMEVDMHEMDQQNPQRPEPAYHLGRLLAVLNNLQYQALGNVNATLVDRFYGSFSTTPASILGRLMQSAPDYVAKIRSHRGDGAARGSERRIADVLANVNEVPDVLSSQDQALFSLGFYHERAAQFKAISDAKSNQDQEVTP